MGDFNSSDTLSGVDYLGLLWLSVCPHLSSRWSFRRIGGGIEKTLDIKNDGVVKILHLRRCCKISIITTYFSTPK
jgi:hypothetical protein